MSARILVVDDTAVNVKLLADLLTVKGYMVSTAANGMEALERIERERPDLVLLDIMLPDANGFDVLNRIRQHQALESLPVLMLTSLGERKDITRGLMLGANGYITKPVLPSTLLEAVETMIGG